MGLLQRDCCRESLINGDDGGGRGGGSYDGGSGVRYGSGSNYIRCGRGGGVGVGVVVMAHDGGEIIVIHVNIYI